MRTIIAHPTVRFAGVEKSPMVPASTGLIINGYLLLTRLAYKNKVPHLQSEGCLAW